MKNWSQVRRYPRFRTDVRVVITLPQDGAGHVVYGRCTVIAEGGFGATLAGELPPRASVAAELILPGDSHARLHAEAVVRYRHGFRHGFEFAHLSAQQRDLVRGLCARLEPAE